MEHPMVGGFIDEKLALMYDYNQVIRLDIGTISPDGVILGLDTSLNEIALITKSCHENGRCLATTGVYWEPREE